MPFRKRYIAIVLISILIAFLLAHGRLLPFALRWLDVGEEPIPTAAVFVLLGNNDTRPFVAAALYKTGFAQEILLGVNQPVSNNPQSPPTNEVYYRVLRNRGVPSEKIRLIGNGVTNTMNESQVLLEYMEQNPDANVTVVTTHFHTRRTRWSLRKNIGKHAHRLRFVSAPNDDFDASDWWLFSRGFELIIMEYIKLLGYWVLYGNALWYGGVAALAGAAWIWSRIAAEKVKAEPRVSQTLAEQ